MRGRVLPPAASPGTDPGAGAGYHPTALAAAVLCTGGPDVIRKEAWPFYRTISDVRLCWELEEPKGPKGGGGRGRKARRGVAFRSFRII